MATLNIKYSFTPDLTLARLTQYGNLSHAGSVNALHIPEQAQLSQTMKSCLDGGVIDGLRPGECSSARSVVYCQLCALDWPIPARILALTLFPPW